MEKQTIDREKIRIHFRGNGDEMDYLCRLFSDEKYDEELNHALRLQWYDVLKESEVQVKNLDHILYKLNYEINQKGAVKHFTSKFSKWFSRVAAVLLIPLLIYSAYSFFDSNIVKEPVWVEINAPSMSRVRFSLPDGSTGWLNSNSSLKYNNNFNPNREVILNGEAYFDVKKDPRNQFRVHTDDILVTVHGTRFNIESYGNENTVEVTLEDGKIDYYNKGLNRLYSMKPNDYISYDRTSGKLKVDVVKPGKYTGWKDGKLVFRNDPLDVVARRLGRWYNVDVELIGKVTHQPMLRATFISDNLEEVLKWLKLSLPIDYTIIKGEISGDTFSRTKVVISSKTK